MTLDFKKRAWIIAATQGLLVTGLASRMIYLQGFKSNQLFLSAEGNRIKYKLIFPRRGLIVDRNDFALAVNNQNLQVKVNTKECKDIYKLLEVVSKTVNLTSYSINSIVSQYDQQPDEIIIAEHLTWEQFSELNLRIVEVAGLDLSVKHSRYYPVYEETAHVIGYVAKASKEDYLAGDSLLLHPDAIVGKTGVEKIFDKNLTGLAGRVAYEVNAKGLRLKQLRNDPDKPGNTLKLSIDYSLQSYIYKLLEDYQRATAVVLDINNGQVLAMVSKPSFDTNLFIKGIDNQKWQELISFGDTPLLNRAVTGQYPPGSTFKIATLLAGLVYGHAQDFSITCRGRYRIGNKTLYDWLQSGHGKVDHKSAFVQSCDIYFYQLALKVGLEKINIIAKKLGLGEFSGIELTSEKSGLLPTKAWKKKTFKERWTLGETAIVGIGQGFVLATPLQLAIMAARVASSKKVVPTLKYSKDQINFENLDIEEEHLATLREVMFGVVNSEKGTARGSKIRNVDFTMSGKTGTAQVASIANKDRYSDEVEQAWKLRDHSLFVSFAPSTNPRWATAVVVEHAGHGSSHAAPVTSKLIKYLSSIDKINNHG